MGTTPLSSLARSPKLGTALLLASLSGPGHLARAIEPSADQVLVVTEAGIVDALKKRCRGLVGPPLGPAEGIWKIENFHLKTLFLRPSYEFGWVEPKDLGQTSKVAIVKPQGFDDRLLVVALKSSLSKARLGKIVAVLEGASGGHSFFLAAHDWLGESRDTTFLVVGNRISASRPRDRPYSDYKSQQMVLAKLFPGADCGAVRDTPAPSVPKPTPTPARPPETEAPRLELVGGTGLLLTGEGLILTAYHVVASASEIRVWLSGRQEVHRGQIVSSDQVNDVALLALESLPAGGLKPPLIALGDVGALREGQQVWTLGFPLVEIMGMAPKYSSGYISSLSGLQDDPRLLQLSLPMQPGNSGGPVFDRHGNLVGMCVSRISDFYVLEQTGALPQNVTYSLKGTLLENLLAANVDGRTVLARAPSRQERRPEELVETIRPFIVRIEATKLGGTR